MNTLLSYIHQGFLTVGPFVILLGLLIFVHELGHFLVAVWCGVKVEVFSLGFGKKIFQYKRGDTNYCISIIPLGGYVKMFGDELGSQIEESQKQFSFTHKNVWQRIAIVLAGPLMNFFFAILILTVVAFHGEEMRSPLVGDVAADSQAYLAGFRSGDTVTSVNGQKIRTFEDLQSALTENMQRPVQIEVNREPLAEKQTITAIPTVKQNPNVLSLEEYIGDIDGLSPMSRMAVVGILANTQAEKMGLLTGDRILKINNQEVKYFREINPLLMAASSQQQSLDISVERTLGEKTSELSLKSGPLKISNSISFGIEKPDLYLSKVLEGSPALTAGLKEGDRLTKVNDMVPEKWEDVLNKIKSNNNDSPIKIEVARQGQTFNFEIAPKMTSQMTAQGGEEKRFTIGIYPWMQMAPFATTVIKYDGLFSSLQRGYKRTMDITVMTVVSFLRLIQNKISPKNIGGVISIGQAASETFKTGLSHFLQMMAVISVNLFILNLLPIPVLDGGHLLFFTIEALRGAPVSMRKMEIAQQVGLALLMSLMVFALFNDFSRVLGFW